MWGTDNKRSIMRNFMIGVRNSHQLEMSKTSPEGGWNKNKVSGIFSETTCLIFSSCKFIILSSSSLSQATFAETPQLSGIKEANKFIQSKISIMYSFLKWFKKYREIHLFTLNCPAKTHGTMTFHWKVLVWRLQVQSQLLVNNKKYLSELNACSWS